ncbi:hypothetical protein ACO0LG_06645 [Undibacterium sp. Ji42W]|uniref:hypothetical protein n=1 Tax=Undibacterium sp. Ji42W TaxID=3413039 RepID=UPI003BF1933D
MKPNVKIGGKSKVNKVQPAILEQSQEIYCLLHSLQAILGELFEPVAVLKFIRKPYLKLVEIAFQTFPCGNLRYIVASTVLINSCAD